MPHFIRSYGPSQHATATRDSATGWVTVRVADVGNPRAETWPDGLLPAAPDGPTPNLVTSALVQVLDGGRTIRLAPTLATAIGDAAAGQ